MEYADRQYLFNIASVEEALDAADRQAESTDRRLSHAEIFAKLRGKVTVPEEIEGGIIDGYL